MIEITGKHNSAKCYCDELETSAREQISVVCGRPEFADSKIRIMPDVHAGMGCTIGTTMTITNKVVPGMVGVDIGCGMETVELEEREIDFKRLDSTIHRRIPSGRSIRRDCHALNNEIDLPQMRCAQHVDISRARRSIGTLGGGNHFIEVDRADDGTLFLVIHSGSRHIGKETAEYYQDEALRQLQGCSKTQIDEIIASLKEQGRETEIESTIERIRGEGTLPGDLPKDLAYASESLFNDYIHDMKIVQRFATLNRKAMVDIIITRLGLTRKDEFTTIHNYIDTDEMILRKGAVSAKRDEKLLIPINMRDGSLICKGLGNDDWNQSAPHGAGRIMSRGAAYKNLSLEEYKAEMAGIFTTCVSRVTLDEAPMAYKTMDSIVKNIGETAEIIQRIKPVYNFKAGD
ncbi:MAG: RtcB family protein [Chitinispirillia bacterium]|nr:RtcB family protein [Chitinispirillia bacterium]MCL2268863.1 RtcB family protein [Chitinispirillia bacterium]